jgi:uncharacterized protein (TIRG00374 family)
MRRRGDAILRLLPQRLHDGYQRFATAALATLRRDDLPIVWTMTLAGWALEAARLWLVVLALDLDISFQMLVFVTFAQGLLISAPLTPGGLGVVEPGLTGILLFVFDRPDAVSITLLDRAISYVSVIVLGVAVFAAREAWAYLTPNPLSLRGEGATLSEGLSNIAGDGSNGLESSPLSSQGRLPSSEAAEGPGVR